jgi:hypothetical protein
MPEPLSPSARTLRARIAALTRAAHYDGREVTAAARATFLAGFLEQVDQDRPGLPEAERQRRAIALRRAHFARLSFQSAKARAGRGKREIKKIDAARPPAGSPS